MAELLKLGGCELTPVGLVVKKVVSFEEWMGIYQTLKRINQSMMWAIGDWVNIGEKAYGEKYSQALDVTDYSLSSLQNMAWVSRQIPYDDRKEELSWAHHQVVASLPAAKRNKLLDKAVEEKLPRSTLRKLVTGEEPGDSGHPTLNECIRALQFIRDHSEQEEIRDISQAALEGKKLPIGKVNKQLKDAF